VRAWLTAPINWLPYTKMIALWGEPYGPPLTWDKAPVTPQPKTGEDQIDLVRDFLYTLAPDSVWPKQGDEAQSAIVQGGPSRPEGPRAEAEPPAEKPKKPAGAPAKGKATQKKQGSLAAPSPSTG